MSEQEFQPPPEADAAARCMAEAAKELLATSPEMLQGLLVSVYEEIPRNKGGGGDLEKAGEVLATFEDVCGESNWLAYIVAERIFERLPDPLHPTALRFDDEARAITVGEAKSWAACASPFQLEAVAAAAVNHMASAQRRRFIAQAAAHAEGGAEDA